MDKRDPKIPKQHSVARVGHWLPQDSRHHKAWLQQTIESARENPKDLHPVLREFKQLVENNTRLWLLFSNMFEEIPHKHPYQNDPTEKPQVRDFEHMLELLNHIRTTAPSWTHIGEEVGMVGVPINAILDWPMGTRSGFAVFLDPTVNAMLKKVLNAWGEYLSSPESAAVLDTDPTGWFGEDGRKNLTEVANIGQTSSSFEELFVCDSNAKYHGYKSWDDFFTRHFREEARPVASPEDDDVIVNPCESRTYKVANNVKRRDRFWVKGQPYSVIDMLSQDPLAEQFVGGTIYQAFLSALSYHRWHSPVSGTIRKSYVVDGTYYSEPLYEDFTPDKGANPEGETVSQEYLSAVATRAIIFIEADNPKIGLMAFLGIGMTEVSTCDVTVKDGQHVNKGDEIGMFHFGGSTQCVMFRKGVELRGFPQPGADHNVPVRGKLAEVV
jgi:phosphatidylserine decarboxylase